MAAAPRRCRAAYFLRTIARAVRLPSIFSEKLRLPARIRSEVRNDPLSDSENQVANPLGGGEARSDQYGRVCRGRSDNCADTFSMLQSIISDSSRCGSVP